MPIYYAGWQQPWDLSYPDFQFQLWRGADHRHHADPLVDAVKRVPAAEHQHGSLERGVPNLEDAGRQHLGRLRQALDRRRRSTSGTWARTSPTSASCGTSKSSRPTGSARSRCSAPTPMRRSTPRAGARAWIACSSTRFKCRNQMGPFGYGWDWTDGWRSITVRGRRHGVITDPDDGTQRRFEPDSRGGYFSQPGDHGNPRSRQRRRFHLTGATGEITAFGADGHVTLRRGHQRQQGHRSLHQRPPDQPDRLRRAQPHVHLQRGRLAHLGHRFRLGGRRPTPTTRPTSISSRSPITAGRHHHFTYDTTGLAGDPERAAVRSASRRHHRRFHLRYPGPTGADQPQRQRRHRSTYAYGRRRGFGDRRRRRHHPVLLRRPRLRVKIATRWATPRITSTTATST